MSTGFNNAQQQLQYIQDFLIKIANGNYNAKLFIADEKDEQLAAVQVGINMLVEELKVTTISRVFLNSIYNGINDVLIVLNEKGEIQNTNDAGENLLQYTLPELLHQSIENLFPIGDIDNVRNSIRNTYEHQKIQDVGLNLIAKDKSVVPVSCSFSLLHNNLDEPSGVLLVAKDITTLLNAKYQLQEKNDELNLFVYKASHDLKSPLSSIIGLMTLHDESEDVTEMKMYSKMVADCTSKLDNIISDLLVLGRITYGELEYDLIDIKQIIDAILKSIKFVDGFKDISFNIIIDEEAKSVISEKGLFQTILFNLIDNSIKYRQKKEEPSYINIHISCKGNGILFKIEDNGIGIANNQKENIFKMFYRATSVSNGSGLGLYIVNTSVLKLGGTISFESTFGKGTTFSVYIPSR